jgi:cell shape-determining protein MreC
MTRDDSRSNILNIGLGIIYKVSGTVVIIIVWLLDLQLPVRVQSVTITTKDTSLNPAHSVVYSIQHYVINFASHLRQVGDFLRVLWFPPLIKLTATI